MNHQRALAIIFTTLMLASSVPAADATHISSAVPDVPTLPHVKPTQDCTATTVEPQILAKANELVAGNPAFYQDAFGAPAVCLSGVPLGAWQDTVVKLDSILNSVRNASRIVQRQVDERLDATLPETLPGAPLQLVEPRTVLLNDSFNGKRTTGFGDWRAVTERGDAPNWHTTSVETLNGTRTTYRFGDESGYVRGDREWLVSPEIDLTALQGQKLAVQDLVGIRQRAHDELFILCEKGAQPLPAIGCSDIQLNVVPDLSGAGGPATGNPTPVQNLAILYQAYEMAIDSTIYQLPVMQHSAYVDLTYRMNFQPQIDGVRMWIYVGDRQPDRTTLFDPQFGVNATTFACATDPTDALVDNNAGVDKNGTIGSASALQNIAGQCTPSHRGGTKMGESADTFLRGMNDTSAFGAEHNVAFTGELQDFVTQRLNLTPYMGERVWLLFEAKTKPNDRGADIFHEPSIFPHPKDFGFELARVYAEGDGYLRNLRLKDVAVTFPYATRGNTFNDDPNATRTTAPPGNDDIAVWVHNAGDYYENATFTLNASQSVAPNAAVNVFGAPLGTYTQRVSLAPDEVQTLRVQWSKVLGGRALSDGYLYQLQGALNVDQIAVAPLTSNATGGVSTNTSQETPDQTPHLLDPNITQVRPANAAGTIPGAGSITMTRLVRAARLLNITALRADQQPGEGLQFCSAIAGTSCTEQWVAAKGAARQVLLGIRNDGNAAQTIKADLSVKLDGVEKPDIISDGAERVLPDMLPGEMRVVNWTVIPTAPGAYDVGVALIRGDGTPDKFVSHRMFVQRSTGLICLDTISQRECGPTLDGAFEPTLAGQPITASTLAADGTLYVATRSTEADPDTGAQTGMLAARDPKTGSWSILRNLSATHLNDTDHGGFADRPDGDRAWGSIRTITVAPDGGIWLAGDNRTALHVLATGAFQDKLLPASVDHTDLTASMWHDGTLYLGGTNGTLLRLDNGAFTPIPLTYTMFNESGARAIVRYDASVLPATIHQLIEAPNGDAIAIGDAGLVMRNPSKTALWTEANLSGDSAAFALQGLPLRGAAIADGSLVIVGGATILVNDSGTMQSYHAIHGPAPLQRLTHESPIYLTTNGSAYFHREPFTSYVGAVSVAPGHLDVLDNEGRIFGCTACFSDAPTWEHPELALPMIVAAPSHPAQITQLLGDGTRTFALGEGDLVMQLADHATYADDRDWTTEPTLAPHDGGIIATVRSASAPQAFLAQPGADGQSVANAASRFRLFVNHSVGNASLGAPADIQAVYVHVPALVLSGQGPTPICTPKGAKSSTAASAALNTACNAEQVRHEIASYTTPSPTDGWNAETFGNIPSSRQAVDQPTADDVASGAGASPPSGAATFYGIEFYASAGARWAIDDLHLQGCNDTRGLDCSDGKGWKDVLAWRGPSDFNGSFYTETIYHDANAIATIPNVDTAIGGVIPVVDAPYTTVRAALIAAAAIPGAAIVTGVNATPSSLNLSALDSAQQSAFNTTRDSSVPDPVKTAILNATRNSTASTVNTEYAATVALVASLANVSETARALLTGGLPPTLAPSATNVNNAVQTATDADLSPSIATWGITARAPFDLTTVSPWHISTGYADAPVFAANNENYLVPSLSGGSAPRLLSNWNSRLVSPVIDLHDSFDPAISFRQLYAFRTQFNPETEVHAGDGGLLEVQYLRQGAECQSVDPAATCGWSPFYPVKPDGGYPGTVDLNLQGKKIFTGQGSTVPADGGRVGDNNSYWGRMVVPDATGTITGTRVTDSYKPVTITLAEVQCGATQTPFKPGYDCVPANLSGRQIRVAFHLYTAGLWSLNAKGDYDDDNIYNASTLRVTSAGKIPTTVPGEGWYVKDFKVLGSRQLGIDLAATHMTFRVGYDVANIGVGPGTRVPVNVTVENHGMFDALGYTGTLEVRRIIDRALQTTQLVDTIVLPQQPLLAVGKSANHTIFWNVPATEGANYTLSFTLTPIGIDRDEDPLDNVAHLGSTSVPVLAKTARKFNVEFLVSPQNATIDITRYIPMYINNTGNVPVDHLSIERRITTIGTLIDNDATTCAQWQTFVAESRQTAIVDCRDWTSQRAAPAGTLTPITQLSDGVNPTADLFWKAPERASYLVSMAAQTQVDGKTLVSGVDQRVNAFATYIFDDVEGGPRGESERGSWVFGPGWNATQPGFRSTDSYAFGDPLNDQYPANANASLVTPTIDLGNARTAGIAFYHRYKFEDGFDGGVIEASADGGNTWKPLNTTGDSIATAGYNLTFPMQASSPIHPNGDPDTPAYGFTGDSALHPASVDSWVLSQVDLTSFADVTEQNVPYESYGASELQQYSGEIGDLLRAPNVRTGGSWCPGDADQFRCWEVQNITEHAITPPTSNATAPHGMWWSGSPSITDDGKRPIENQLLEFDLPIADLTRDQRVTADWWEYGDRFGDNAFYMHNELAAGDHTMPPYLRSAFMFANGVSVTDTTRYNLGKPSIVETRGKWIHMVADITDLVKEERDLGYPNMTLGFSYTPLSKYSTKFTGTGVAPGDIEAAINDSTNRGGYGGDPNSGGERYVNDPGLAIDGFTINATRYQGGQPLGAPVALLTPDTAWSERHVTDCGLGGYYWNSTDIDKNDTKSSSDDLWHAADENGIACMYGNRNFTRHDPPVIPSSDDPETAGRAWALVNELPSENSSWGVVNVRDENGAPMGEKLPTGDVPKAWYTGEIQSTYDLKKPVNGPRVVPNSESRLVTPAFDLGKIAGDNAALSFWHRYAFYQLNDHFEVPLASGGVVEIQVYDAPSNTWSDWQQLYTVPADQLDLWNRGGYSGVTANTTPGPYGLVFGDSPFHNVVVPGVSTPVQFLFTGKSTDQQISTSTDGWRPGWLHQSFDLTPFIGKKVRVGFHVAFNGRFAPNQGDVRLDNPDGDGTATPSINLDADDKNRDDKGGWWIDNVSILGDVIEGKPVQVRLRAGTDGNVQQGSWQVDDFGVYGSRYRSNVALVVNKTANAFGAYNNSTTTVPLTIRNLGTSVRRDLAVEVINGNADDVTLNFTAPGAPGVMYDGNVFRITGITVGPAQSVTVNLSVRTPSAWGTITSAKLLFALKEFSPAIPSTPYVTITDNEVQGLLTRSIGFGLQKQPAVAATTTVIRATQPAPGDHVDAEFGWSNDGFGPATLNLTCTAQTITGWTPKDHRQTKAEASIVSGTYPCQLVSGLTALPAKAKTTTIFRVTPTAPGFLQVHLTGNVVGGATLDERVAGIAVGVDAIAYHEGFDDSNDFNVNWTDKSSASWEYLRGVAKPGALLLGVNDNTTTSYSCAPCAVDSPVVDLHNFTNASPAFLSFYHMDRFGKGDGARIVAQKLNDETKPQSSDAGVYTDMCVLVPSAGYEGYLRNKPAVAQNAGSGQRASPGDPNPIFGAQDEGSPVEYQLANLTSGFYGAGMGPDFFVSPGGVWDDSWNYTSIDLSKPCYKRDAANGITPISLLGADVRFRFEVWAGQQYVPAPPTEGDLHRGRGQGMFVDDFTVGPSAIALRPGAAQHATLVDNTTKTFHVVVTNLGSRPDIVHLEYDALNSSAPEGSIQVASEHASLSPGESRILNATVTLPRDPSLLPTDFVVRILARSDLDRNAAARTNLQLSFAPRPWPELGLTVEAPTGLVQEGTEAFLPITIENSGLVDSLNTTVRITDTWNGGNATTDLPLASMPSYAQSPEESTRVLEFRWRPEKGSVGPHMLRFEVDPDHLGEEYTRTNNVATLNVSVTDLLIPDLYISNFSALTLRNAAGGVVTPGFDADVARYEVTAGELVSFDVKVKNIGRAGATNVDVRAFIGALSLPPKSIPYVGPGNEVVVTFNWLAQKGEHNVEFLVRSEQVELSTANNRYPGTGVALLTVKGYEVSVDIPDISGILEPGQALDVNFSVHNAGNAGEDLVLVAHAPAGSKLALPKDGFFLRAGETYTDKARLQLSDEAVAGEQFLSIDAIARENPMKVASGRAAMRVNASYGGSLTGGLSAGSPPGFVLPIELTNEGNSLEPWNVTVQLPAGWSAQEKLPASVSVPAHGRTTLSLHLVVPVSTTPGDRVMQVRATLPDGTRREGLATASVLPLRAAAVTVANAAPKPEKGALTIPVTVENKGNVQQPFTLLLMDKPAGVDIKVEPALFDLAPGASANATLIVKPDASVEAGTYAVTGYTLFQGVGPQTAEGRANVQSLKVPILRQDLRLSPLEYSPRAGLSAGDHVSVKVTVSNRGLTEVTNVPVHLFVDDVFISESIVPALPAGGHADVTFNWTAQNGPHTLTAVVDPYQDTVEADRANTAVSALATVGTSVAPGGVAAGKANTPMPGAGAIIIVALAAALILGAARRQRR